MKRNALAAAVTTVVWLDSLFRTRLVLMLDTGGRGVMSMTPAAIMIVAILILVASRLKAKPRTPSVLHGEWQLFALPYLGLTCILPMLGVIVAGAPARTLYALVEGAVLPACLIVLGGWLRYQGGHRWSRSISNWLVWSTVLELGVAVVQYTDNFGGWTTPFRAAAWLREWDVSSQRLYDNVILGRAIGSFVNPNVLGFWSLIAFWGNFVLAAGWYRAVGVSAAVGTLFLSGSRGSLVALMVTFVAYFLMSMLVWGLRPYVRREQIRRAAGLLLILVAIVAVAMLTQTLSGRGTFTSPVTNRFESIIRVATIGVAADENLSARISTWKDAISLFSEKPFGTWRPPQHLLGRSADNQWVYVLLQGGFLYVVSQAWLLVGAFREWFTSREGQVLALWGLGIAVNGLTALTMQYSPAALFWLMWGSVAASNRIRRHEGRDESMDRMPGV